MLGQLANTDQGADSSADADQNGVNANAPVVDAGGDVSGGSSSAYAERQQLGHVIGVQHRHDQPGRQPDPVEQRKLRDRLWRLRPGPVAGPARHHRPGRRLVGGRRSERRQRQRAGPIGGGDVRGGSSAASRTLDNSATSSASNTATTTQAATRARRKAQAARSAVAAPGRPSSWASREHRSGRRLVGRRHQNGVNANVPVSIAGGDVTGGSSARHAERQQLGRRHRRPTPPPPTQAAIQSQTDSSAARSAVAAPGRPSILRQPRTPIRAQTRRQTPPERRQRQRAGTRSPVET